MHYSGGCVHEGPLPQAVVDIDPDDIQGIAPELQEDGSMDTAGHARSASTTWPLAIDFCTTTTLALEEQRSPKDLPTVIDWPEQFLVVLLSFLLMVMSWRRNC
jgi:hypothetical protein